MRKNSVKELLSNCKITELNIDKQKEYIVNVEVGDMKSEAAMLIMKGVVDIFKNKLELDNCIFMPMVGGKELINIRELEEDEADHIVQLYNKLRQS